MPRRLLAPCCSVLVINGAGRFARRAFLFDREDFELRTFSDMPRVTRQILRRAFGLGVGRAVFFIDNEPERLGRLAGLAFVGRVELLAAEFRKLGNEGAVIAHPRFAFNLRALAVPGVGEELGPFFGELLARSIDGGGEDRTDAPVLIRDELFDFLLAIDHQPNRHALHPTSRQSLGDFAPKERRDLVADDAVEDSTGLLSIHAINIDCVRRLKRLLNLGLGDGIKDDALHAFIRNAERLLEVPGDGFTFAVQVGRQIDVRRVLGELLQFADQLALAALFDVDVFGDERFEIDTHAFARGDLVRGPSTP